MKPKMVAAIPTTGPMQPSRLKIGMQVNTTEPIETIPRISATLARVSGAAGAS
jgi:hypothetical protein